MGYLRKRKMMCIWGLSILSMLCVLSCGKQNIFQDLVTNQQSDNSVSGLKQQLDNAKSVSEYTQIKENALTIIQSASATPVEKKDANILYGLSIMGENEIKPTDIFSQIASFAGNSFSSLGTLAIDITSTDNIFGTIESSIEKGTTTNFRTASLALNTAQVLVSQNVDIEALSVDDQLMRGIINMLTTMKMCTQKFNISMDNVERKDSSESYVVIINELVNPDNTTIASDAIYLGVLYYSEHGVEGLEKAKVFTDKLKDTKTEVNKIKPISQSIYNLFLSINKAGTGSSGNYTLSNSNVVAVGLGESNREVNVETAVNDIFKSNL